MLLRPGSSALIRNDSAAFASVSQERTDGGKQSEEPSPEGEFHSRVETAHHPRELSEALGPSHRVPSGSINLTNAAKALQDRRKRLPHMTEEALARAIVAQAVPAMEIH